MLTVCLTAFARLLLALRYRIRLEGLAGVAERGTRGILFLPNHPALIDPPILVSFLHARFRPVVLADKDQIDRPGVRLLARLFDVLPLPDPVRYGEACRAEVEAALARGAAHLRAGGNLLIYPAGRINTRRLCSLGGNSAVETLLKAAPEARVVLIRTRGLWGSLFSRASGSVPRARATARRLVSAILASGLFFMPRRRVDILLHEPADFHRAAGREAMNRFVEEWYNKEASPNTYVPYTPWERGGVRTLPEPGSGAPAGNPADVPEHVRRSVLDKIAELAGGNAGRLRDEQSLTRDVGLDSLNVVDLALWLEREFGFPVGDGDTLHTVGDALLAACGTGVSVGLFELEPPPPAWFSDLPRRPAIPPGETLTAVFLAQARRSGRRILMADQSSGVRSGRELLAAIALLRPCVEALPGGPYVGILLPASVAATTVYFAVLFAGRIPVMLNWTTGARQMRHAMDLLEIRHVLTSSRMLQRLEATMDGLEVLRPAAVMLEDWAASITPARKLAAWLRTWFGAPAAPPAKPSDTAAVLFTSGSESLPKAVPLTHANLLANLRDFEKVFEFEARDRLLGVLPPFHSFGLSVALLLPMTAGIPVVYHPNPTEGGRLAQTIAAYRVSLLAAAPTFLRGILKAATGLGLGSLRVLISGGERCPDDVYDLAAARAPEAVFLEGYGVTECAPVVSVNAYRDPRRGTIGRPLPSVECALMDWETGLRAGPGKPGMLLVRGPNVFGGYLKHEDPSPFVEFEGRRWYRTGDLVVERDGVLVFAGRLKRFVKIGAEMISLPAIEEALLARFGKPEDEAPALAVEGHEGSAGPEIVLFTGRPLEMDAVAETLREAGFSALCRPRRIVPVDAIPLLGTGKTDYRALRALVDAKP